MIKPHTGSNQINTLTGIRAYAAVWVMLLHFQFSQGVGLDLGKLINHGFWAVDIFFVLSGFILAYIYRGEFDKGFDGTRYRNYLVARFARIYPLHILALAPIAFYFLLRLTVNQTALPSNFDFYHLFLNIFLVHAWGYAHDLSWNYPSWSISAEWFAYLLMLPLLSRFLRNWSVFFCLLFAFALWSVLYLLLSMHGQLIGEQAVTWAVPRIICEFTLGYALCRLFCRWQPGALLADAMMLAGLGMIVAICFFESVTEWWLAPAVAMLILGLAKPGMVGQAVFGNRWAVYWGERSYSIYMLHAVVQIYMNLIIIRLPVEMQNDWSWTVLVVSVATVMVSAHLAYIWVEVPARRYLRKRLSRPANMEERPVAAAQVNGVKP